MPSMSGLKREREEEEEEPAAQGMASRRRVQPAPAAPTTDSEAARLVKAVRREFEFAGKPAKYGEFLAVLNQYKHRRLGVAGVIGRMKVILQGHPYVIRWFNKFLPSGKQIKDLQAPPRRHGICGVPRGRL